MGTGVTKLIGLIVGILVVLGGIKIGMTFYNKTTAMAKTADSEYTTVNENLLNTNYAEFDGREVSGTDAINAIRLHAGSNFTVTVTTCKGSKTYNKNSGYNVTNIADANYIEPTARFDAILENNDNGTVNGIKLTQIKSKK